MSFTGSLSEVTDFRNASTNDERIHREFDIASRIKLAILRLGNCCLICMMSTQKLVKHPQIECPGVIGKCLSCLGPHTVGSAACRPTFSKNICYGCGLPPRFGTSNDIHRSIPMGKNCSHSLNGKLIPFAFWLWRQESYRNKLKDVFAMDWKTDGSFLKWLTSPSELDPGLNLTYMILVFDWAVGETPFWYNSSKY
jgi:hypothetical protein